MHTKLLQLDQECRALEPDLVTPPLSQILHLSDTDKQKLFDRLDSARIRYNQVVVSFDETAESIPQPDLAAAYPACCKPLKRILGGFMYRNYSDTYLDTMIQAIKRGDEVSYVFLGSVVMALEDGAKQIVVEAIFSGDARLTTSALGFVQRLQIKDAEIAIRQLLNHENALIVQEAEKALAYLGEL